MNFQEIGSFWKAAEAARHQYDLPGKRNLSLLYRSENVTFLLSGETDHAPHEVLRVARPGYHTLEELQGEIRWLERLAEEEEAGGAEEREYRLPVKTARPIKNRNGEGITLSYVDGRVYACVMFEFLEGTAPDPKTDADAVEDFRKVGAIAATFHRQTMAWKESRSLCRPHWDYEGMLGTKAPFGNWREYRGFNSQQYDCLEWTCHKIKERLERYGKTGENYGLIHSDLRAANLLKHQGQIRVLDFDDCGFGWHMYDLAASISFIEDDRRVPSWIDSWLEGYETVLPLKKADKNEIPTFLMARRIQLLAWITSHDDSDPVKNYYPGFADKTVEMAVGYLEWIKKESIL